ncbi:benzoate 4-monooxygenase [Arthroderma uncinatum]|uniref:benzoate 4-monooxygenase n=1 Tax=Arthroderma uncinatum TaxID=74035 RepID=UPI00144A7A5F|nr:benzoate 4-monooxygenase [Arthroderma uncinatum]KAF3480344.1 benzoate 4-monooxygenase [Arthroderma uncinatum]
MLAALVVYYTLPVLASRRRRDIPGPFLATFTNFWLFYQCRRKKRSLAVELAHKKYGKFVRIQPNHISIAAVDAIQAIYGHGNGFLKSDYYDAFAGPKHRSIFNTRDRDEHSRKRRAVSHIFSAKSVGQFEQYICNNIRIFVGKWNGLCDRQQTEVEATYAQIDALPWFSYLSFDIIGDLAFGAPFGMLSSEDDLADACKTVDAAPTCVAAIEVLNRQGEVSATLGCYPQLKPFSKYFPDTFFQYGVEAIDNMAGIAIERVKRRLNPDVLTKNTRVDMLAKLMESRDEHGDKLSRDELITESLTFLVAGSNTTAVTLCSVLYFVVSTPGVLERLQGAIDEAVSPGADIPSFDMVKHVSYLQWVIWETFRVHSAFSLGLPRQIPKGNAPVDICEQTFYPGDVLSVPTYTLHHSTDIWGPDAEAFIPERWDPTTRLTTHQKDAFMPFGVGPRACIGRNLAEMELKCIVAAVFRNFEFKLEQDIRMDYREGFIRKPSSLKWVEASWDKHGSAYQKL